MSLQISQEKDHSCRNAFFIALITAMVIFIPVMIWDKGYFFFFGDFNVQQIPFYKLAHEAVRSGDVFWNWYTDLGANFIGSYSFYLIGSPFFWLTLPFPTEFVPHLMAPLLMLKHACAAFVGCLYIKRFVKHGEYAVFGGLLYAFSGFAVYNIFFNHFHEAIIFFPLLLIGIEELIVNNRRGVFALAVAINAFVNYWFFIGEVVFVLIYFVFRSCSPDWKINLKKFLWTGFEAVIGLLLAMCLFLPSVMAIMGNPRTGTDELLKGWDLWLYWHNQMYPAIVSSFFFPPDLPSRPNLFPDRGAKWASLSAWLPFISMSGVLAYLHSRRDWLRKILLACFLMAMVPALNSMFILFNSSYYARWFYMLILLMALASARAMESPDIDLKKGITYTGVFTLLMVSILGLTPVGNSKKMTVGLIKYPAVFIAVAAIAVLSLAAFALVIHAKRGRRGYMRYMTTGLCVVSVIYSMTFIGIGKGHSDDTEFIRETALAGRYEMELDNSEFARSDIYNGMDNLGMYWHLPNIQAFHSIIPVSTMEFYPKVGVKRDVSSKPETKYYQLRSLLSVKWFFVSEREEEQDLMPGYELDSVQLGYNVYRNKFYIPMGFTFDSYITVRDFEKIPEEHRAAVLLHTLVIKDEAVPRAQGLLEYLPPKEYNELTEEDYYDDCEERIASAGSDFQTDKRGFTSRITLPKDNFVFYSVPYDNGWTATVNGAPAIIEKADIGFMAVRAPAGENTIRFEYETPGLRVGMYISLLAAIVLIAYVMLYRRYALIHPEAMKTSLRFDPDYDSLPDDVSLDETSTVNDITDTYQENMLDETADDKTQSSDAHKELPSAWFDEKEKNEDE